MNLEANRVRMVSKPYLIQIDTNPVFTGDYSIYTSSNHETGGACFGDSGGPFYITGPGNEFEDGDVIAGVTSWVINGQCAGMSGVYRIDQKDDLDWLQTFF